MTTVGVRELRQRASELLRLVERGETIEITDRGRAVALLGPIPTSPFERLRAAGDVVAATGSIDDLPEPIEPPDGTEPLTAVLERQRSERL